MNICIKSLSPEHVMNAITALDNELAARLMACVDIVAYAEKLAANASFVVAESEDISGLIAFYINDREDSFFVPYVCVDKMYRGTGLADRMMAALCAKADELCYSISLEVRNDNLRAMRLYERYGFVKEADCVEKCRMVRYSVKAEQYPIMVTVVCCTYNQENYISQCLDGFVAQKTNFPFEVIVHDDASTDGTAAIVKEYAEKYPDIIKPIYQTDNLYSKKNGELSRVTMAASRGKYIAICEGDDWWCDPLKLQKQVDYMEVHPEISVCATEGYILNQCSGEIRSVYDSEEVVFTPGHFLRSNPIFTVSTLSRADWMKEFKYQVLPLLPHFLMGDYPMWMYLSAKGPVALLKDKCFVYRELDESASHFKSAYRHLDFYMSVYDIRICFNRLLKLGKSFMVYRKFRDVRRECRWIARERNVAFGALYRYALGRMFFHSAFRPSRKVKSVVCTLLNNE